jgi:hypothetical protein
VSDVPDADLHDEPPQAVGLGHLAACAFEQSWGRGGRQAVEHLRHHVDTEGEIACGEYAHDAGLLVASPLSGHELELIWFLCTGGNHRPGADGMSGREWIRAVHDITAARAGEANLRRASARDAGLRHLPAVERLVGRFAVNRELPPDPFAAVPAAQALTSLASSGQPDLAFRLFMAMVAGEFMPLTEPLFQDMSRLTHDLGYPTNSMNDYTFLIKR